MEANKKFYKKCSLALSIGIITFFNMTQPVMADDTSTSSDNSSTTSSPTPDAATQAVLNNLSAANQSSSQVGSDMGFMNTDSLLHYLAMYSYVISYYTVLLPSVLKPVIDMANSWLDTNDTSGIFATDQGLFATLWNDFTNTYAQQLSFSQGLTSSFLIAGAPNKQLPAFTNDLSYSTVLGSPILPPQQQGNGVNPVDAAAQNFIANASGSNIVLSQGNPNWVPSDAATQYNNLYKTLAAIQSYDSYLVSGLYKQQEKTATEESLTAQASNPSWFSTIASESLGLVLRQILMYTSQQYVETQRLIELQRQQLAVSAMTNVLLGIVTQGSAGTTLQQKASQAKQ